MAGEYIYPTNQELTTIAQKKQATLALNDPIFQFFPIVNVDADVLSWEQEDDYKGLQQIRGLNGQPKRVNYVGGKRFLMEPGYYGEFLPVDEAEMTRRRQWGTFNQPVNIDDLVTKRQDKLLAREIARIRQVLWTLVSKATFSILDETGQVKYAGTYTDTPFDASVAWSDLANATPLADIRAAVQNEIATDAMFNSGAVLFLNPVDAGYLFANRNANDLGGRRTNILSSFGVDDVNKILVAEDLPQIVIYNGSYLNEAGTAVRFLDTGYGVIMGVRNDGGTTGDYAMTRNAQNEGMAPGPYDFVYESPEPPKNVRVHRGHNGGVRYFFPSAVKRMLIGA